MDNQEFREPIQQILEGTYVMSLATLDDEGVWVADVTYIADDELNIYWMSKPWRRHSAAIDKHNAQVAGTITLTTGPDQSDAGLQLSGKAEQVAEIPWECVERYFVKRRKPKPQHDDDILGEHLWYRLVPNKIELIYSKLYGQDRQTVR